VGKAAIPVQILTIIGLATVVGGAHSMFKPVSLTLESEGFRIPGEGGGETEPPSLGAPAQNKPAEGVDPQVAKTEPAGADETADTAENSGNKIDLALSFALHERAMMGEPIWFLDARRQVDFDSGRIAGALFMSHSHVSSGEGLDELAAFSAPELDDLLVIYCTGGDCQASEDTAILLEQAGYGNMAIMEAGYDDWVAAGYPTEGP